MTQRTRISRIAAGAGAALIAVSALTGAALAPDQPWRDASQAPEWRAQSLLSAMTADEKVTLILATNDADFAPLAYLGIPEMRRVDASGGLRGDTGVTAFPAPNALGATFDTELASEYGAVIGAEAHDKRWNVVLGPTVDIDRNGLSGRAAEGYGEDTLVNGRMGAAVSAGVESEGVITMLKHFAAYAQESGPRETLGVTVPERALRELYYPPFETAVVDGGADSVMCAYPRVNGTYACENPDMLSALKTDLGLDGYVATDFDPRSEWISGINAGVDSQSLFARTDRTPFTDGRISAERVDDAAYRILLALFDSGAFDAPLPAAAADVVTNDEHLATAVETGEEATVLLKNSGVLPLSTEPSVAVIGPAGADAITGIEGSSYVNPGDFVTPAEAITAKAGETTISQGSLGDVALPTAPASAFGTGLDAEYFGTGDLSGPAISTGTVPNVDFSGAPVQGLPSTWSARFSGTITPTSTGILRLSSLLSGSAKVTVNGETVFDGTRFIWDFFFARQEYTLGGVVELEAGVPADIEIEYSTTGGGFFGPRLTLGWQPDSLIPAAVEAARNSDVAVVFANEFTGEAVDRVGLSLPGDQNALIEAVAAVNPNTIVVLHTPGPVLMPWLDDVAAVTQAWYQGAAVGDSIANVLYGDADPGGRLPMTFPASTDQGPALVRDSNDVTYDEGIYVGYKWYDQNDETPLFPFGYGESYTDFAYSDLSTTPLVIPASPVDGPSTAASIATTPATASVTVTNTGDRSGSDVVQFYTGALPTDSVDTVDRALAGFAKVDLEPGESRRVTVELDNRVLSYWDTDADRWATPTGAVPLVAARSAVDDQLSSTVTVAVAPTSVDPGETQGTDPAGAQPGASGSDTLAATGNSTATTFGLVAGVLLLMGAGLAAVRRRRSRNAIAVRD
ncbi:glycoside hydrolase family 3 C-terminal domain-containing protein [Agreia sp. Leaf283]|uniref:glycoside hydrolase family 3 C-terminal domain-containing protein n=1 Tax=Agreia sp. Leaf283 TaxID=1736321 RepID=UPI0009EB0582|nr:glycoside hydrolase family 3 C-terminal domain-containing protein [Agreia sp. Leaf283]